MPKRNRKTLRPNTTRLIVSVNFMPLGTSRNALHVLALLLAEDAIIAEDADNWAVWQAAHPNWREQLGLRGSRRQQMAAFIRQWDDAKESGQEPADFLQLGGMPPFKNVTFLYTLRMFFIPESYLGDIGEVEIDERLRFMEDCHTYLV